MVELNRQGFRDGDGENVSGANIAFSPVLHVFKNNGMRLSDLRHLFVHQSAHDTLYARAAAGFILTTDRGIKRLQRDPLQTGSQS